jgi:hypothetical protein
VFGALVRQGFQDPANAVPEVAVRAGSPSPMLAGSPKPSSSPSPGLKTFTSKEYHFSVSFDPAKYLENDGPTTGSAHFTDDFSVTARE